MDFKKAKGSSDARESDHIERKVIPDNADPTRTHLNRELVKMPSGVYGRDEAIAHRIKTAGIKRKITNDQVRNASHLYSEYKDLNDYLCGVKSKQSVHQVQPVKQTVPPRKRGAALGM